MATLLSAENIMDRARYILKDMPADDANRRWTEDEMLLWVNEGYRIVIEQRPDLYVQTGGAEFTEIPIPYGSPLSAGSDVFIHPQKAAMLVDFVLSRGFAKDSETGNNDLSTMYLKLFYEKLK